MRLVSGAALSGRAAPGRGGGRPVPRFSGFLRDYRRGKVSNRGTGLSSRYQSVSMAGRWIKGVSVSRAQYAFLIGVLLVWLAWAAGWVVFPAIAAGLIGWGAVRVLEGDVDLGEITERFRSTSTRPPRHP